MKEGGATEDIHTLLIIMAIEFEELTIGGNQTKELVLYIASPPLFDLIIFCQHLLRIQEQSSIHFI